MQKINPRVSRSNYVDKVNGFKLYIAPSKWKVVPVKRGLLAVESRACVGKAIAEAGWGIGSAKIKDEAQRIAARNFVNGCTWVDEQRFTVDDCPAVVVAARGEILLSKTEQFRVTRTVAVAIIKFGVRSCIIEYIARPECYEKSREDFLDLVRSFTKLKRRIWRKLGGE